MIRAAAIALALLALSATAAPAAEIVIRDGATQPENLTVTPEGDVITGSFSTPLISIVKKGTTAATTLVDLTNDGGGTTLGVLADGPSNTLWACQRAGQASLARAFDLKTGAPKLRWVLPSPATCNDFTVGPDRTVYVADTTGKIYRIAPGSQTGELLLDGPAVAGIDGIAFLNGVLYYNSITSGKLYRVPLDAAGKASAAVEIVVDSPLSRPDGMRAAAGKLFVAEQGANRVSSLTITGDTARRITLKEGLQRPTGVAPDGDMLWYAELTNGKVTSIPLPR